MATAALPSARRRRLAGLRSAPAAVGAALLGAAPHVLHHAGPFAGAALLAGVGGQILFGALGFVLALPMLWRLRRRSGSWRLPAGVLALMAAVFTASSLWLGPAISGNDETPTPTKSTPALSQPKDADHDAHHP